MCRIEEFTKAVKDQSNKYHPDEPSTISFATLIYPPQFCWFPANGPEPYTGFQNKLSTMTALNNRIKLHNDENFLEQKELYGRLCDGAMYAKSRAPGFHTFGLRKITTVRPNGRRVGSTGHRWEGWRVSEAVDRKLHLAEGERKRIGSAAVNFLKYQFKGN